MLGFCLILGRICIEVLPFLHHKNEAKKVGKIKWCLHHVMSKLNCVFMLFAFNLLTLHQIYIFGHLLYCLPPKCLHSYVEI